MIINKKNIKAIEKYFSHMNENDSFILGVDMADIKNVNILKRIGFTEKLEVGERVLPSYIGSKTKYNGEGKKIPVKDLPKETFYVSRLWSWKDWRGNEHSKIISIPRERYQRKQISPPSIELTIGTDKSDNKYVYADTMIYNDENRSVILSTINMFLEIFGTCTVFKNDFKPSLVPIKKLNWEMLPPGKKSWNEFKNSLEKNIFRDLKSSSKKAVYEDRLKKINNLNPDFIAVGNGGFSGYIVLGFKEKKLYILENLWYGNATYIFDENWEMLSQLTKMEVLSNELYKHRIIHDPIWESNLNSFMTLES